MGQTPNCLPRDGQPRQCSLEEWEGVCVPITVTRPQQGAVARQGESPDPILTPQHGRHVKPGQKYNVVESERPVLCDASLPVLSFAPEATAMQDPLKTRLVVPAPPIDRDTRGTLILMGVRHTAGLGKPLFFHDPEITKRLKSAHSRNPPFFMAVRVAVGQLANFWGVIFSPQQEVKARG